MSAAGGGDSPQRVRFDVEDARREIGVDLGQRH